MLDALRMESLFFRRDDATETPFYDGNALVTPTII